MRVSLIQGDLAWEQKSKNLAYFRQQALQCPDSDLILLPEMFTTGFTMNAQALAEPMDGPSIIWMQKLAQQSGAVICGSLIISENGQYYNRLIWMPPDGQVQFYDKRHLFTLAGEEKVYSPGQQRLIVHFRGFRICPLICYDLRFPIWSRNHDDYDLLVYVANFPAKRRSAWNQLLLARAIENQCYTIGLNRVGEDINQHQYAGDSTIIDYEGKVLVKAAYQAQIISAQLSLPQQQSFRQRFPFWKDADQFHLE